LPAGSAGCATFAGFPRHIIPQCHTEIIPFLHICQTGLATNPDIIAESSIDLDGTLRVTDHVMPMVRLVFNPIGTMGNSEADLQNHKTPALSFGDTLHRTLHRFH
jgi:hypothetical protein